MLTVLEAYSWPGNVRELENIIKRLALAASINGSISREHVCNVSEFKQLVGASAPLQSAVTQQRTVSRKLNCISAKTYEQRVCRYSEQLDQLRQLVDEAGNLAAAARLRIPRTTLRHRLVSLQNKCAAG